MRRAAAVLALSIATTGPAAADWTPVQVGPYGPIIVQDWGLYRPGAGVPRILDGPPLYHAQPLAGLPGPLQRYFPHGLQAGDRPARRPVGHAPRPSEPFFRMWQSHPPLSEGAPQRHDMPAVNVEVQRPPK